MKKRIEVTMLSPNVNVQTGQLAEGTIFCFKEQGASKEESVKLSGSQKSVMDMFKIENFSEIVGKKFELEYEMKDGAHKIMSVTPIDDRPMTAGMIEEIRCKVDEMNCKLDKVLELEKKVDCILGILRKHIASDGVIHEKQGIQPQQ